MAKAVKVKERRYQVGDRVRVNAQTGITECIGVECVVRRAFRDRHGEGAIPRAWAGQEEWVYEVDIPRQPGRPEFGFRSFWERLLDKVA